MRMESAPPVDMEHDEQPRITVKTLHEGYVPAASD